ncbi:Ectoine hydrolase [subsurface metagenome]
MKEGDAILFELGGVYNRYTGALMRSAVLGKANDKIKRMNEVCAEGLQAAIDSIRPGVTSGEVDEACRKVIEKAGFFENYKKRTGYSIGCSYPPDWGEGQIIDLKKDDPRVLEPGMVFHIPPALRVLNEYGVGVSETVVVTDHGCEVITNFDRKLFVAK